MQPKRGSLPLLFLLSFAAIFLDSYHYHSSLPHLPQPQPSSQTLTLTKALTSPSPSSSSPSTASPPSADYSNDRVNLHVFVDHFRSSNSSSDDSFSEQLRNSHRILEFVDGFEWSHGDKMVHYRTGNAGLQAQWLEAWWPGSDDEFAFVVEDDLEVSPLFYRFFKGLILKYYYDPDVYGALLQRPRFVAGETNYAATTLGLSEAMDFEEAKSRRAPL